MRLLGCLLLLGCPPTDRPRGDLDGGTCEEPDPRDPKGILRGEPCETSYQCTSDKNRLVCQGEGLDAPAVCQEPTDLWDPDCVSAPEGAPIGHCDDAELIEEVEIGEEVGCAGGGGRLRTYEIPDTCCPDAKGDCAFDCTDFIRQEVWRNCGCCWRLVRLIEEYPKLCL